MIKYKFDSKDSASAAQKEILESGWVGATKQDENYIGLETQGLTSDLILDIERVIKKHGGKAKLNTSLI